MQILSNLSLYGTLGLNSVADANTDTDKFLVIDSSGIVKYRTGAELYSDIGAGGAAAYTSTLQHTVKAGVALTKGQAVYVSSADGTNMIVSKASSASEQTSSKTLGLIAQDLAINDQGFVITEGLLAGLNTSTANAGDPVWLGTDGNLIYGLGAKPYAPDHLVFVGIVTRVQQNNGEIFVKVQNGFELQELHNVQITSTPSDNAVLAYETSTSLYKMKSISTLLGYTPVTNARNITINGTTYDLSADRSWSVGTHTGNLTTGYVPKATGATTLTDSLIYDNGSAIGINTASPYESSAFKLDVNGGVIIKNTSGTAAQLILINSNPATGGNNGFVQLSAGGNTATAFGQWQTYYGMSVASGALRLQPAGGQVLIGTSTASAFLTDINGTLRVSGQLTLGSTISSNTYVYTMPGATGTLALVSDIPSLSGYLTISSAAATYLTQTSASNTYLTLTNASATYLSQTSASNTYLTLTNAAATYLSQTSASNTYLTLTNASATYLSQTSASNTYLTLTNASSTYLTQTNASNTYVSLSGSYANPSWITALAWSKITGAPAFITSYTEVDTLASVTGRGASTTTTLSLAKVVTTGLYGPGTSGEIIPIWQYNSGNPGYGIAYEESSPDKFRIDVSGSLMSGTPDFEVIPNAVRIDGNTAWHAGNLTNLNQLTNGPGYITGYTETDTLSSVISRGNTTGGNIITSANMYASIFYDYANNGYYGDFAGTSNMYRLQLGGGAGGTYAGLTVQAVTGNTGPIVAKSSSYETVWSILPWTAGTTYISTGTYYDNGTWVHASSDSTNALFKLSPSGTSWYSSNNSTTNWNVASDSPLWNSVARWVNNVTAPNDVRAPIFYDSNDTTYYLDPNSTSYLYSIRAVNDVTTEGGQGRFGGWYTGTGYTGAAVEVGFSGGNGNVISYNRITGGYQPLYIAGSNLYLQQQGGLIYTNSQFVRQSAGVGWLSGNYASSETTATTGAIYSIGGSYYPTSTSLNTMYGIGYTYGGVAGLGASTAWGLYVVAGSGSARVFLDADNGIGTATGSWRAPIFYDSNDTTYYGDFSDQSRMYRLNLSSGQVQAANNAGGRLRISSWTNGESVINGNTHSIVLGPASTRTGASLYYAGIAINGLMNYGGVTAYDVAPHIWIGGYYRDTPGSERSDFVVAVKSGTGTSGAGSDLPEVRFRVDYEGIATASGSFRAPVFYDSDDTGYYADFNSTSNSAIRVRGGMLMGPNPTWGAYLQVGGNGSTNSSAASVVATNGNLHLDSATGFGTYINHYYGGRIYFGSGGAEGGTYTHSTFSAAGNLYLGGGGTDASYRLHVNGTGYATSDFRAPIFYDSDNTGYYGDFASTSNLNYLVANYIGVGQTVNTSYRIITSGDYYANAGGNYWAEGRFKQYRGSGTWHDVIDSGNIGSQSVNYANYSGYADRIQTGNNQWIWSNGAHTVTNSNTITLWDQYGSNGGSGYPTTYGTILDIYGRGSHEHDQLYFSYDGQLLHRNCFYGGNTWSGWRTILNDSQHGYAARMNQDVRASDNVEFNQVSVRGGLYVGTWGNSSDIYMTDGDEGTRRIHCNSNRVGFLNQAASWGSYCDDAGNWVTDFDMYCNTLNTGNVINIGYTRNGSESIATSSFRGIEFHSPGSDGYRIGKPAGAWTQPLHIAFYTGIRHGANLSYNGHRWYNSTDFATITASINDGDNNMRGFYDIIAYASDRRLKENIQVIDNPIDKVKQLTGMTYQWNEVGSQYGWDPDRNVREAGVFAQDVEAVLPEAVKLAPFDSEFGKSKSGENFLTVKYEKIVPLLIEAIKEQQTQIENLKSKLDAVTK